MGTDCERLGRGYHSDPLTSNILEYPQIIFSIVGNYCERVREEEANTVIPGP